MAAGYETTASALGYATYELARNPEVLDKLQAEVDELVSSDNDDEAKKYPDYDIVAQMPYMDLFISEVLRMHPIGTRGDQRRATENTVVQGIQISKGNFLIVWLSLTAAFNIMIVRCFTMLEYVCSM